MAQVGSAFVSILPSARGFGSALNSQVGGQVNASGRAAGQRFGTALKAGALAVAGGAAIFGGIIASSVNLEAQFSKTMNVLQATTGASSAAMQNLDALALKMGADTVFSANDAGQAMLELARGGISAAAIQAGALEGTLTLAAAGELEMGEAANVAVKAMGQFNLQGRDMGAVAASLAGAANASSASVRDMSVALAQGGLAAHSVGFSIQETTGILAAFSNAGLEGSDAGTSLKTMLDRLQPSTSTQSKAMRELGIVTAEGRNQFLNANGTFKSAIQIAGVLAQSTEGLNQAERKRLITAAFGSDAQRAATILSEEGAAGLRKLTKATSDQDAAQELAAANMKGTAGALEAFKGSVETAQLQLGRFLAPAIQVGLRVATDLVNGLVPAAQRLTAFLAPVVSRIREMFTSIEDGGGGFQSFATSLIGTFNTVRTAVTGLIGAFAPFVAAVLPSLVSAGQRIASTLLPAFSSIANLVSAQLVPTFQKILPVLAPIVSFLVGVFASAVVGAIKGVVQAVTGVVNVIAGVVNTVSAILHGDWSAAWNGLKQVVSGAVNAVIGIIKVWLNVGILSLFRGGLLRVRGLWAGLWNGLRGLAQRGAAALNGIAAGLFNFLRALVTSAVRTYISLWRNLFTSLVGLARAGWAVIRGAFSSALAIVRNVVNSGMVAVVNFFRNAFELLIQLGVRAFVNLRNAVSTGVTAVVNLVRGIPGQITSAMGNLGSALYNSGAALIQGLINGITSKISAAVEAVQNGLSKIKGLLPGSPIKWGPLKGWNNTGPTGPGGRLVGLLASGLSNTRPIDAAMNRLSSRIAVQGAPRYAFDASATAGGGVAAGGRALVHIENQYTHDPYAAARATRREQEKALVLAGLP